MSGLLVPMLFQSIDGPGEFPREGVLHQCRPGGLHILDLHAHLAGKIFRELIIKLRRKTLPFKARDIRRYWSKMQLLS